MQVAGVERAGELDGVAGAVDVEALVDLVGGRHVVHRGEVEEVLDRAVQAADLLVGQAEARLLQIADDGLDALGGVGAPALDERGEAVTRALAHEHVDVALALEQLLHEMAADEAGRARHEIRHCSPLP